MIARIEAVTMTGQRQTIVKSAAIPEAIVAFALEGEPWKGEAQLVFHLYNGKEVSVVRAHRPEYDDYVYILTAP